MKIFKLRQRKKGIKMITIINNNTNPHYNLAFEEYVFKNIEADEDIILLWQNAPAIIVGRNQNTFEEINHQYVKENNIYVVRRPSGGGAVYHDLGNLNFTFITSNVKENLNNYEKFAIPVIKALNELGVPAEFAGRNDILVDGMKISGNAQTYYKQRMLHHGTILFSVDLNMIAKVLQVKADKIASKGIKSTRSRVTNILPYLKEKITMEQLKHHLLTFFLKTDNIAEKTLKLTEEDYKNIKNLTNEKYNKWEWNFGESPKMEIQKSRRYAGGNVEFNFNIESGKIVACKIFGDFFGERKIEDLEEEFVGTLYTEEEVYKLLKILPIDEYFFNITIDNIIDCIFY